MGTAGVVADALALRSLLDGADGDAGLRMLRQGLAPFVIASLSHHLGGQVRRVPAAELYELVAEDILALREAGMDLPQTARSYCDEWRRAGILVRTTAPGSHEELYELSAPAEAALRYVSQIDKPRAAVTQSRLMTISTQLEALARDTDPSPEGRLASLRAERERIEAEIAAVEAGDFEPLPSAVAAERLADIIALAEAVPADFARVRADLAALNRALREQVVAADASRGEVLDDVFRGVDRIEESEAGRSFRGFYELLLDPQASARLDDDLESVLAREVGSGLDWEDRRFLIGWRQLLVAESGSVRATMTGFSRALNAFVRSRLFEEHRRLTQEVRRAQLLASRVARQARPGTAALADETLLLTGMTPGSIAGWRLRDPSELVVDEHVETHEVQPVDMELVRAVMRETEIDMGELSEAVNAAVRDRGPVTIAQVLEDHPATQGLASVLGLMLLAVRYGQPEGGDEEVCWAPVGSGRQASAGESERVAGLGCARWEGGQVQADDGVARPGPSGARRGLRRARIARYRFDQDVPVAGGEP